MAWTAEDEMFEQSGEFKRLQRLGIDPYFPDVIIYMMLKSNVRTIEELVDKLREKYKNQIALEDENNSSE
jgi:hypothetical protein